ncbi:hypothetical protein SKAU_G00140620 [Synaphobranchus kaupii]|uniref:Integrase catalytic domain-containing protein n=1 Tax=Synaphobranchus kaupii TaxID=118154 RepID=A0A9Q1FS73_SYNKA|nr:hypothetical protein SKAU_G00140620 [Synaphobranchus kaupii]
MAVTAIQISQPDPFDFSNTAEWPRGLDDLPPNVLRFRLRLLSKEQSHDDQQLEKNVQVFVDSIVASLPVTEARLKQIQEAQAVDETCRAVTQLCLSGWPEKDAVGKEIKPCWHVRDYFSRYVDVAYLRVTSSEVTVNAIKEAFARRGIPEMLVSDNGPQFVSEAFRQFAKDYNFTHTTSSPRYPQANGDCSWGDAYIPPYPRPLESLLLNDRIYRSSERRMRRGVSARLGTMIAAMVVIPSPSFNAASLVLPWLRCRSSSHTKILPGGDREGDA